MKRNVGNLDRIIRIAIGLVLVGLALTGSIGWWGYWGGRCGWELPRVHIIGHIYLQA